MNKPTITLLVDDEKTVLDSLRQQIPTLIGEEVECETAESADEAWEVLEELMETDDSMVILIVSDWLMPRTKGDELLERVRERYPSIYRVMLTGQADEEVIERLRKGDLVDRLLFKPWDAESLREALTSAMERDG